MRCLLLITFSWATVADIIQLVRISSSQGVFRCSRYTVACEPRLAGLLILDGPWAIQWRPACFCRLYALHMSYRGQMEAFPHCVRMTIFSSDFNAEQVNHPVNLHRVPTIGKEFLSPEPVIAKLVRNRSTQPASTI